MMNFLQEIINKVRYKISRYIPYIKVYGIYNGVRIKRQVYHSTRGRVNLPGYEHPIFLRPNTIDRYTFKEIFLYKEYDIPIEEIMNENSFIIDGGANVGFTSLFFNKKFNKPFIVSVEPERSNFKILQRNTSPYNNIDIKLGAIWHEKSKVKVMDRGLGSRSFTVELIENGKEAKIETYTISGLMKKYDRAEIDLLKLDIEGSEKFLFEHEMESNTWMRKVKCMIVEPHDQLIHGCTEQLSKAARKYGFFCKRHGESYLCLNEKYESCKKVIGNI